MLNGRVDPPRVRDHRVELVQYLGGYHCIYLALQGPQDYVSRFLVERAFPVVGVDEDVGVNDDPRISPSG